MRSNIKVFYQRGYLRGQLTDAHNILSYDDCELFYDIKDKKINPEIGKFMVKKAEKFLNEPIPFLPLSAYRDYFLTEVRSRFESKHHHRRDMLLHLTIAEAYERQGRFVEKIADLVWAIMDESTWCIPAHSSHSPSNKSSSVPDVYTESEIPALDLYAGNCCATLALVRHLLSDELDAISPIITKKMDRMIYLRGIRPYIVTTYAWMGESVDSFIDNWLTNITQSILFAAAVTVKDFDVRKRVVERAMRILDNFTAYYPQDGCCDEGPGYWGAAGGNYFDCLELLEDMSGGKIKVYDHPIIKGMGEYIAKFNIDGRYYLNFADAAPRVQHDGKMIARFGAKCGSEELESFGQMVAADNEVERYYFFGMCYRVLKNAYIPELREAPKTKASKSVWYADNKIAIFRESEDTSKGLYLATKGGNNGEMHNHNDVGCIVVYSNGNPLIVDPSHGSYDNGFFGSTRYDRWFMKSSYHSVPTVDGVEEAAGKSFASTDEVCDLDNQTVTMNLAGAFPESAGVKRMQRTCTLSGGVITVRDEVEADHEADIRFNFLFVDKPEIKEPGVLILGEGRTMTYDTALMPDIEKVENTYLPYDDLNFMGTWGRECLWRVVLSTHRDSAVSTITIR